MLGLFDTPTVKIRKKIPSEFWPDYDQFNKVLSETLYSTNSKSDEFSKGFLLSVWAINNLVEKGAVFKGRNAQFIQNLGQNCMSFLSMWDQITTLKRLETMMEHGVIDLPPSGSPILKLDFDSMCRPAVAAVA